MTPVGLRVTTGVGVLGLLVGAATTLARYVPPSWVPGGPDRWGVVTAFTDFGVLGYLIALLGLGVGLGLRFSARRLVVVVLTVGLTALHLAWIVPRFVPAPRPAAITAPVRVFSLNMQFGGADPTQIVSATREADVVVLTEITEPGRAGLLAAGLGRRFRYERAGGLPVSGAAGTTVFSRFPVLTTTPLPATIAHQNWLVTLQLPVLGSVRLAAVHPARPGWHGSVWARDQRLLRAALPQDGPLIVAGDFNSTESHWPMRRLRAAGLRTSTDLAGAGWQPTWPAHQPFPPLVDIDHIWLSPDLTAYTSTTARIAGTDHLAIAAEIDRRVR